MKRILLAALIVIASSSASQAYAEGAYIGADVIFGHYTFDVPGVAINDDSANSVAGRILAGYNFNQTWAIEGGYADFGTAKYNFSNGSLNTKTHSLYVAAKASVPLDEKFSLFGKLGAARNDVDREGSGSGTAFTQSFIHGSLYAGVGAEYKLNDKFAVTFELEHCGFLNSVNGNDVVISTGLRYNF